MASGRFGAFVFVSILLLSSAAPLASAHGTNTIWIIVRGTYLQPDEIDAILNDNVAAVTYTHLRAQQTKAKLEFPIVLEITKIKRRRSMTKNFFISFLATS